MKKKQFRVDKDSPYHYVKTNGVCPAKCCSVFLSNVSNYNRHLENCSYFQGLKGHNTPIEIEDHVNNDNEKKDNKTITLVHQKFQPLKVGEEGILAIVRPEQGTIMSLPGSNGFFRRSIDFQNRTKENQQRQVTTMLKTVEQCLGMTPDLIAPNHQIIKASKNLVFKEANQKIQNLKEKHKEEIKSIQQINSELLRSTVKNATYQLGLSKSDANKVSFFFFF